MFLNVCAITFFVIMAAQTHCVLLLGNGGARTSFIVKRLSFN